MQHPSRAAETDVSRETAPHVREPPGEESGPADAERFDAIVLGCGVSGIVSASIILAQGAKRIALVDAFSSLGGNHIDFHSGGYTFDVGSLIFQDDSPLLDHFPELLPLYEPADPSWGKLNPKGRIVRYPVAIREEVAAEGPLEWLRILASLLAARIACRRRRNAEEFARFWIGGRLLAVTGLEHYLRRFFGRAPSTIDVAFAEKRMGWIREHATLGFWLGRLKRGGAREAPPTNRQLVRPREGFSALYGRARESLEAAGATFLLGTAPERAERRDGAFRLTVGGRVLEAPRLVSTIPLGESCRLFGIEPAPELPSVTLVSLFYSFEGRRGFPQSILYNFSFEGAWKRLTVYSDFYGPVRGREYFGVEVISERVSAAVAEADADFRRHVAANGLFAGDLKLEGSRLVPYAYPVHTPEGAADASAAIERLRLLGVTSFGRQGGFDYQPTARVSTLVARRALGEG